MMCTCLLRVPGKHDNAPLALDDLQGRHAVVSGCVFSGNTEVFPQRIHALYYSRGHANGSAPAPAAFRRPLVGGVKSDFGAQPGDRTGKVEVVNGRVFHQHAVAHGIHSGADRPDHLAPVAHVDVVFSSFVWNL